MTNVLAHLITALLFPLGCLPLRLLQALSTYLIYYPLRLIGYRKGVIYINLARSFPEWKYPQIRATAKEFYRFLAQTFLEFFYLYAHKPETLNRHCALEGMEALIPYAEKSKIVVMGHYGNWEWLKVMSCKAFREALAPHGNHVAVVYKAPENKLAHRIAVRMRRNRPMQLVESTTLPKFMFTHRREAWTYFLIADQSPLPGARHSLPFLHQETLMMNGPETLARQFSLPVFYFGFCRRSDGSQPYGRFRIISPNGRVEDDGAVTARFAECLEADIQAAPAYWLWSHKRWKRGAEALKNHEAPKAKD